MSRSDYTEPSYAIYRTDGQVFVNQHAYGIPCTHSPVFCFREYEDGSMARAYRDSVESIWDNPDGAETLAAPFR